MRSNVWVRSLPLLLTLMAACGIAPRVPLDVSRAVQRDEMRVLHTQTIDLYYPAELEAEARAFAERAEGCVARLRAAATGRGGLWRDRIELLFPDLPYNNAFVMPPNNGDFFSVVPTYWTLDVLTEFGLPPGPDYVACHELTHYVHSQQTLRTWGGLNRAFGYILTPQFGLDAWFHEGLATYYEQRLSPGTGRPAWPAWQGMFHAAVAGRRITGGHLSAYRRQVHVGNHYLYGSQFIDYLARTYGERKLWELVERQGKSFFFPFVVNARFKRVYGKSLSHLIDEWEAYTARAYPVRTRPAEQRVVAELGMAARYARAPDGTEAWVTEAMDDPPRLVVRDASGRELHARLLTEVLPPRKLVVPGAVQVSGLRFSRDARRLYFVSLDLGLVFQEARLMELDVATGRLRVVAPDLGGFGGDVSPDGQHYVFVRATAEGHALTLLDLATGQERALSRLPRGKYLSSPSFSPDGRLVLATSFDGAFGFRLFDAQTGEPRGELSASARPVHDATFIDGDRILFLGEHEGRFQLFVHERTSGRTARISDVPYLAQAPRAAGGTVRFLNREGNGYTLDELPLPPPPSVRATTAARDFMGYAQDVPPEESSGQILTVTPQGDDATQAAPAAATPNDTSAVVQGAPPVSPAQPASPASPMDLALSPDAGTKLPSPARTALSATTSEDPYRAFPRVLIPSVRAPTLGVSTYDGSAASGTLGLYLGGTDALGKHRWGLAAGLSLHAQRFNGSAGYLNAQAAPFLWMLAASQLDFDESEKLAGDDGKKRTEWFRKRQRDAALITLLALRTTTYSLSAHVTDDYQPNRAARGIDVVPVPESRRLGGGTLAVTHVAVESTPMSGPRRGYVFEGQGTYYPDALGTLDSNLLDLRGALSVYAPLPFSRRHTLLFGLRARGVVDDLRTPLLEVGGNPGGVLTARPDLPDETLYPGLPPKRRFREPLRGFETYPFTVSRIGIADLRYRYPFICDCGTATSLWILPAFFLRQIDLELFAAGAATSRHDLRERGHLALGGAVTARLVWLGAFGLGYQLSRRLTDDRALQHVLTLAADLGN